MITLINPPIIDRKYNFTYSVNLPLGLAYIAAYLLKKKVDVKVIDAVGTGINQRRDYKKNYSIIGLSNNEIIKRINKKSKLIAITVRYSTQHNVVMQLIKEIRKSIKIPIVIGGPHATFNYKEFLKNGADYVVLGEGEVSLYNLILYLQGKIKHKKLKGVISKSEKGNSKIPLVKNIDMLPFPARKLFPLHNYYKEKSGFGPSNNKFTPIISSRGCPNNCSFCSSAVFWQRMWRPRSPKNVIDEIQNCIEELDINEFHFVDDNLTLDKKRITEICNEMIKRKLDITWGATNGIRPENVDFELLKLMKKSGCTQITLAPETGSQRLLKDVFNKSINLKKILKIASYCNKLKIKTSIYIIIGAIGEKEKDRLLTKKYVKKLAKKGADEIGVFPLVPYPECPITEKYKHIKEIRNWEELITGIIPSYYPNYNTVKQFKKELYTNFLFTQIIYHPLKILRLIKNFILKKQETKSDRVIKNMIRLFFRRYSITLV